MTKPKIATIAKLANGKMANPWGVVELEPGMYGVANFSGPIRYLGGDDIFKTADKAEAKSRAKLENRKASATLTMTPDEFRAAAMSFSMTPAIEKALYAIIVELKTWKVAADEYLVTESGICRAMVRMKDRWKKHPANHRQSQAYKRGLTGRSEVV